MKFLPYSSVSRELRKQAFELYVSSFPQYERRSESCHEQALTDHEFVAHIVVDENDTLLAILFYWQHEKMIYVEHIAVNPQMRGQNIGSTVLTKFLNNHEDVTVILEIDPPVDDVAIRRLRFYSHLGFVKNDYPYLHPSYTIGGHAHELVILSHGRAISQSQFDAFVSYMHNRVISYID